MIVLFEGEFMKVTAQLRSACGSGDQALILALVHFRTRPDSPEVESDGSGVLWWRASLADIAASTGMTKDQARGWIRRCESDGFLESRTEGERSKKLYRVLVGALHKAVDNSMVNRPQPASGYGADTIGKEEIYGVQTIDGGSAPYLLKEVKLKKPEIIKAADRAVDNSGDLFDRFWAVYPRRVGKPNAQKSFVRALKGESAEVIIEAARIYGEAVSGRDLQFVPHPATWLNQRRWADEITHVVPAAVTAVSQAAGLIEYYRNGGKE